MKSVQMRVMGDRIISLIKLESRLMTPAEEAEYTGEIFGYLESRLGELDVADDEERECEAPDPERYF